MHVNHHLIVIKASLKMEMCGVNVKLDSCVSAETSLLMCVCMCVCICVLFFLFLCLKAFGTSSLA